MSGRLGGLAVATAVAVVVSLVGPGTPALAGPGDAVGEPPSVVEPVSVPVSPVAVRPSDVAPMPGPDVVVAPVWPVAGSVVVPVSEAGLAAGRGIGEAAAPGGLPVAVRPARDVSGDLVVGRGAGLSVGGPSSVRVSVASQSAAEAVGVSGVVVGLARADGVGLPGDVAVDIDYAAFRSAYGGAKVPGRVPGSYANYTKTINVSGETIAYTKTTVVPDGSIAHVKNKLC